MSAHVFPDIVTFPVNVTNGPACSACGRYNIPVTLKRFRSDQRWHVLCVDGSSCWKARGW